MQKVRGGRTSNVSRTAGGREISSGILEISFIRRLRSRTAASTVTLRLVDRRPDSLERLREIDVRQE
jgi:hypothetical protein